MSKKQKLLDRLQQRPNDFTYKELVTLLTSLGYVEDNMGKTSGSTVRFYNSAKRSTIRVHKPHPGNVLKMYQLEIIIRELERVGIICKKTS